MNKEEKLKISKMLREKDIDDKLEIYLSPDLYCYVHNYIVDLKMQIDQLTNNWNELEEIILKEIEKCEEDEKIIRQNKIPKFYDIGVCAGIHGTCKFILDKMKEIKEKNNVLR